MFVSVNRDTVAGRSEDSVRVTRTPVTPALDKGGLHVLPLPKKVVYVVIPIGGTKFLRCK